MEASSRADRPQGERQGGADPKPGDASFEVHTSHRRDHMGAFVDAVREGTPVACNVDLGCSTLVAIKMCIESYRQHRVMRWDPDSAQVIDS